MEHFSSEYCNPKFVATIRQTLPELTNKTGEKWSRK